MRSKTINLAAFLSIMLGGAHLVRPSTAAAVVESACCYSATESCCGTKCSIDSSGDCYSCSGFWDCLFY